MSLLRAAFEKRGADPRLPWGNSRIPLNSESGLMSAGVPMNEDNAMSIATVNTAVGILADAVSTLPLTTLKRRRDGVREPSDKVFPLVENPGGEGIRQTWLAQLVYSLMLRGNFYGQTVDRDKDGYPTCIVPLHPDQVWPRRSRDTGRRLYNVNGNPVPTENILHIPGQLAPGSFVGLSPVEYMRQSWALAAAAEKYGASTFANSAIPQGFVSIDGDLGEEETLEFARALQMNHQGVGKAGVMGVLTGGAKWNSVSMTLEDAQFLATRAFQRDEIFAFFRIPPHLAGFVDRTMSWGAGIEQMEIGFCISTLMPILNKVEAYLSNLLPPAITVQFDLSGRLRGDTLQRYQAYQLGRNAGFLCVDEIRAKEGLPPLPDGAGQTFLQPLNMGDAGEPDPNILNPPKPTNPAGVGAGGGNPLNSGGK